jgi:flagellar biosynthesis protein FlhB
MDDVERTLPASERRRAWARERGYSVRSAAFTAAVSLATAAVLWLFAAPAVIDQLASRLQSRLQSRPALTLDLGSATDLVRGDVVGLGMFAVWGLAAVWVAAAAANLVQTGFVWSPGAIAPDVSRIDPTQGVARMFSRGNLVSAVWSLVVLLVLCVAGAIAWRGAEWSSFALTGRLETVSRRWLDELSMTALQLTGVLATTCVLDVIRRRWQLEQSLRMSLEEQREEAGRTPVTRRR